MSSLNEALVSAVSSKLCHDMATPIGSMGFAIEMNPLLQQDKDLISTYETLKTKLEVVREIFRHSEDAPQLISCLAHLKKYGQNVQTELSYTIENCVGPRARLIFGMTWLLFESIHGGGNIQITASSDFKHIQWDISNKKGIYIKADTKKILLQAHPLPQINSSNLLDLWVAQTMTSLNYTCSLKEETHSDVKKLELILSFLA